ncbi:homeobox-leucine zipper protein HOX11-like [Canna indica]|uniref:Homeobox-leucine zipper protein HOX11-like n=1 Tax=Canna indica TaxID=4628 RepID=A0AAQ3KWR8_9LILI|nr:homeobox-leucine zipper protein HOX11-like [Canna indica]
MELGLRLGEAPAKRAMRSGLLLGMGLGVGRGEDEDEERRAEEEEEEMDEEDRRGRGLAEPPLQLDLLPLLPSPLQLRFPWATANKNMDASVRGFDVNQAPSPEEGAAASSSPNSTSSSFQMDFSAQVIGGEATAGERGPLRVSDEEENGLGRKKLRLSKEQSAFLEESFKEHNTLNPKQKLALAKQLNLRPRQVEVWFQNRRARTKLKQTEVDCEYLKRCCQTLTEENRRLQKEVAELRALKTSHPFYMHVPATTLSMCPSCERVASTSSATIAAAAEHRPNSFAALFSKPSPLQLGLQPGSPALRQSSPAS